MKLSRLFTEFFNSEKAGGFMLVFATVISIFLANSSLSSKYIGLWHNSMGGMDLLHWINDALMAVFFLLIGLELEREIYSGELSSIRKASLPIFSALGGMLVPAAIYILFNAGKGTLSGAGIPMATDIAFAIGILSLLGNRVPPSLKIFLTALAVIDDLGAIIIIAIFYTASFNSLMLLISLGVFFILLVLNRLKVTSLLPFIAGGILMWILLKKSGVHPTLAGVLLAFAIPYSGGGEKSPSYRLQHSLHWPVAFLILPLFALANTAIPLNINIAGDLKESYGIGIMAGLLIGKPLGILLFSLFASAIKVSDLPPNITWKEILGAGFLGGIGFTMSIFITLLAFDDPRMINSSKTFVLMASVLAGAAGYFWLNSIFRKRYGPDLK